MDGGGGFVHVPETRPCVLPNHNTLHSYSISHLLVYVVASHIHCACITLKSSFYPIVIPLVPVIIPLAIDRNLLIKRDSHMG